jgi:hypothetical protein
VPAGAAQRAAELPPVGSVFAAFLGFNPVRALLGPDVLGQLSPGRAADITGPRFFPDLISAPVHAGLVVVFLAAAGLAVVAALASALRGDRYVHVDNQPVAALVEDGAVAEAPAPPVAGSAAAPVVGSAARPVVGSGAAPVAGTPTRPEVAEPDAAQSTGARVSARLAP